MPNNSQQIETFNSDFRNSIRDFVNIDMDQNGKLFVSLNRMNPLKSTNKQSCSIWTQHLIVCGRTPWLSCFVTEKLKSRQTSIHCFVHKKLSLPRSRRKAIKYWFVESDDVEKSFSFAVENSLHVALSNLPWLQLKWVFNSLLNLGSWRQIFSDSEKT